MDSNASILFGLAGGIAGFYIPDAVRKVALYKWSKKTMAPQPDRLKTSPFLRSLLSILNMAVWALAGLLLGSIVTAALLSLLFTTAVVIALIDLRTRIIPNELVVLLIILGAAFQVLHYGFSALLVSVACMVTMMVLFSSAAAIVGRGKVGAGDVKLAGAMGLALGYPTIQTALIILCAALFIYSAAGLITKKLTLKSTFPFAPFMTAGMGTALICTVFAFEPFF